MNVNVLRAVFSRNFVSYFMNPTGYVFICVFVMLSTIAAFWPNEFFNANLANLDQLNLRFPLIMLVFIPAITMAIWADERRQGTDELLLTIPAADLDIVLGKYLAAVAIYSVSLVFALSCDLVVLSMLGTPDVGLFLGTCVGYWLIGLAMLAVGMVASFLTPNLTVAYILGALFNVPLVFAYHSDAILASDRAMTVKQWSIGQQFYDFGRGVISFSGIAYFVMIVIVMLYLCMVLIGRRHWSGGREGKSMIGHFVARSLALAALAVGVNVFAEAHDLRWDVTSEKLSSLSPDTLKLLSDLKLERPVQIEAFISPKVPESYVQARLNLLTMLRELQARGGEKVHVRINPTERYTDVADRAEKRYGIVSRQVASLDRGAITENHVFMGVAFTCGLQKVILPFIDRGIPAEYELVRSLCTVTQQKRKRVGVLQTDAQLYGQFNMQSMSSSSNWPIVDELEKQYDVTQVDPASPITEKYDVLLAVQPSSLGPEQMQHFVDAIQAGQPTAIFEDPMPIFNSDVPATSAPRQPPGGGNPMMMMMGGGRQNQPKGDIGQLWRLLGVDFGPDEVIWQQYNPYPKATQFPAEFVFVDEGSGAKEPFASSDKVTGKLQHMLFPFPGAFARLQASSLQFTPLVRTGPRTGTVRYSDIFNMGPFGPRGGLNARRRMIPSGNTYVLAAQIKGKFTPPKMMADEGKPAAETKPAAASQPATTSQSPAETKPAAAPAAEKKAPAPKAEEASKTEAKAAAPAQPAETPKAVAPAKAEATAAAAQQPKEEAQPAQPEAPKETDINVILVADVDMLSRDFFRLREQGSMPDAGIQFDFDNVTFVLNVLDELAGDERFIDIRSRRPRHRTLTTVEETTEKAKRDAAETRERFNREFEEGRAKEQKQLDAKLAELKKRKDVDPQQALIELAMAQEDGNRRLEASMDQMKQQHDREITRIETALTLTIRRVQDSYKMWAGLLPLVPPLLVGFIVWANRRSREREGVARSRLR